MGSHIGKVEINGKVYSADLTTDWKTIFLLKVLDFPMRQADAIDVAIGLFESIGRITLISGYASSGKFGALEIQTFDFQYLIKGHQFLKIEDIRANILSFEAEILKKIFTETVIYSNGIEGELPKKSIKLVDSSRFKVNFYEGLRSSVNRQMNYSASQYKYLSIKAVGGSLPIWDLIQIPGRFKKVIYLLGFTDSEKEDIFTFVLYKDRVKERFQLFGWDYKISKSKFSFLQTHDFKFSQCFDQTMIQNWIFSEDFQQLFDILFERHFLKQISPENSFLNSVFALERFHRTFVNTKSSLDKRIKYFSNIFESILPNEINLSSYLNCLEITRHSLSHFEEKPKALKGVDLLYASIYIEAVLVISLLSQLGISKENLDKLTKHSRDLIKDMYYNNKALRFIYPSDIFTKIN